MAVLKSFQPLEWFGQQIAEPGSFDGTSRQIQNASHAMAIVGEPCNVDAQAKIPIHDYVVS